MTEAAAEYERLLRELHELFLRGGADTPEHEAILDQMDRPWDRMTDDEREQMQRLSDELYDEAEANGYRV